MSRVQVRPSGLTSRRRSCQRVEVEPGVAVVGDKPDPLVGPIGVRLRQQFLPRSRLVPRARRPVRVDVDLTERVHGCRREGGNQYRWVPRTPCPRRLPSSTQPGRSSPGALRVWSVLFTLQKNCSSGCSTWRCPVAYGEAVLMDDIRRHAADDAGHQLLGVHRPGAHGEEGDVDVRIRCSNSATAASSPAVSFTGLQTDPKQ